MAKPFSTDVPGAYVDGLTSTLATVRVLSLDPGLAETPDVAQLHLTNLTYDQVTTLNGRKVIVYRGNPAEYVFVGYIRQTNRRGPAGSTEAYCVATDVRTDMEGIIIGETDLGEYPGGFFGVGAEVVFNPQGKPNRQLAAQTKNIPGGITFDEVYRFAEPGEGAAWTVRNALLTLLNWYVPPEFFSIDVTQMDAHPELVSVALSGLSVELAPISQAITAILRQMGFTWTLRFDQRPTNLCFSAPARPAFIIMGQDIAAPVDIGAWLANPAPVVPGAPAQLSVPVVDTLAAVLVSDWESTESIDQSVSRIEVRAEEHVCDVTWEFRYDDVDNGTLVNIDIPPGSDDYVYGFQQQPSGFASSDALLFFGAAGNLNTADVAGTTHSVRVPWLRRLRDPAFDALGAAYDDANDVDASDCLYIFETEDDYNTAVAAALAAGGSTVPLGKRVRSGYKVNYHEGVIYLKRTLKLCGFDGETSDVDRDLTAEPFRLYFTCACRLPVPAEAHVFNASPMPYPRARVHRLRDVASYMRELALIPKANADIPTVYDGRPAAWTASVSGTGYAARLATGVGEPVTRIMDPTAELNVRLAALAAADPGHRFQGKIVFSRAPWINIGDRIYWPYLNPGWPEFVRVFDVHTDFTKMQTTVDCHETFM